MAVRKIETEIALSGEKAFNDGMKSINSNLKNLRTDMAAVSAEFDDNANSVDALSAKQKILQETVDQQKEKVDALRQMYEKQVKTYGENSAAADKYRQALNQATVDLHKSTKALDKNAESLKKAEKEARTYTPVTQKLSGVVRDAWDKVKEWSAGVADSARHAPVLGEALDMLKVGFKGVELAAKGAAPVLKGAGTVAAGTAKGLVSAAGGLAKGVGLISAASAAGVAAIAAGGVVALTTMANFAKESAEAAKAAKESGQRLTESQKAWLEYSGNLESLDASVSSAKAALGGVLLPVLKDLSGKGTLFLNDFSRDMEAAAGDAGKQGKVMSDYIVRGAKMIKEQLPEYVKLGKELLGGLGGGLKEAGPELLDIGVDLVMKLLDGIIEHAPELAEAGISLIQKLTESLIEHGPELMTSAVDMVSQIVMGLAQAAPQLIPAAGQLITQLILALIEASPQLLLAGLELVYGIISGLIDGLGDIAGSADEIIETIKTAFSDNAQKFLDIGDNIVKKIWGGISAGTDWIYDKISGWVGDVVQWIKSKLGIDGNDASLSSFAIRSAAGLSAEAAFRKELAKVNGMITAAVDTSFNVPEFSSSRAYSGRAYKTTSGNTVNLYFYAKTITEADINMVVDIVNRKLGDDM